MDFKIDIRILSLSILIHFVVFGFLTVFANKQIFDSSDTIEVVFDDSNARTFVPSEKSDKKPKDESKTARFFSEQQQSFEKESIAENLGVFKNQPPVAPRAGAEAQKVITTEGEGPNFFPTQADQSAREERQSAVNFQVPNLARGEMTFLNSDFSTYASFYNRITPKIVYNWGINVDDIALFPHMREKLRQKLAWKTRVELILDSQGHFRDVVIVNSSGSFELDNAVQAALENAAPFLNPPTGMIGKDKTVRIQGEFTVHTRRPRLANP